MKQNVQFTTKRMSIFALGIMPYITASIIMQLLTATTPQLEQLKKEGESGRRKITQYTRYGTLGLGLIQSAGMAVGLQAQGVALVSGPSFIFDINIKDSRTSSKELVSRPIS